MVMKIPFYENKTILQKQDSESKLKPQRHEACYSNTENSL